MYTNPKKIKRLRHNKDGRYEVLLVEQIRLDPYLSEHISELQVVLEQFA